MSNETPKTINLPTQLTDFSTDFLVLTTDFIDSHLRELRFAVYGVGFVGACIVFRSLRVFGQFKKASSIPKEYFKKNIELHGVVRQINSETGHLMIEHVPIIKFFTKTGRDLLPVSLSGVRYGGMGYQWLDVTTKNQRVAFTLLRFHQGKDLECIVKSDTGFLKQKCLNLEMVRLGMGQTASMNKELQSIKPYRLMYRQLLHSESEALRHRNGVWSSLQPSRSYVPNWADIKDSIRSGWKRLVTSYRVRQAST